MDQQKKKGGSPGEVYNLFTDTFHSNFACTALKEWALEHRFQHVTSRTANDPVRSYQDAAIKPKGDIC